MKSIEIIEIRLSQNLNKVLENEIGNIIEDLVENEPEYKLKLFNKIQLKSDYMIIIYHEQELSNHKGSELGQRLKVALKDFGMINYNAWNELL
jgi:hypothetical protein